MSPTNMPWRSYAVLFAMLCATGLGLPLSEDAAIVGAAALTFAGVFQADLLIVTAVAGVVIADALIVFWGARFGVRLLRLRPFSRFLTEQQLQSARDRYRGRVGRLVFATRFLPGLRLAGYFAAGTLNVPARTFLACDLSAACIEVSALVLAVRLVGGNAVFLIAQLKRAELVILSAAVLVGAAALLRRRRALP